MTLAADVGTSRPADLEEYLPLFAAAEPGQHIGEASPSYLCSRTAARADRRRCARTARIIAILREPASFLRSLHLQLVQRPRRARAGLAQGDRARAERREGRHDPERSHARRRCMYSDRVRYVEQLRRYDAVFARRAGAGADLRRLPRRQRGRPCARCSLPGRGRRRADRGDRGQPDGAACARGALDELDRDRLRVARAGGRRR